MSPTYLRRSIQEAFDHKAVESQTDDSILQRMNDISLKGQCMSSIYLQRLLNEAIDHKITHGAGRCPRWRRFRGPQYPKPEARQAPSKPKMAPAVGPMSKSIVGLQSHRSLTQSSSTLQHASRPVFVARKAPHGAATVEISAIHRLVLVFLLPNE